MIHLVTNWERIKKELDSLNLFYSAITGRSDEDNNFRKMGFEDFEHLKIKDKRSEEGKDEGTPDFALLQDNYLCLIQYFGK